MPVLVKDIMSQPVYTIDINKTAGDAGKLMYRTNRGALIVTKNKRAIGIVTDSDLIRKVIAKNLKPSSVKIKNILSKPLITVHQDENIVDAARKLRRSSIKRLPVVERDGNVLGIISQTDIAATSPELVDLLENRLKSQEEPFVIKEELTSGVCDSCGDYSVNLKNINDQWLCESCRDELEAEE